MSSGKLAGIYRPTLQALKNQAPNLTVLTLVFVITFMYASGFVNPTVRQVMMSMTLIFPIVISISLVSALPAFNYAKLDDDGILFVRLGVFKKTIKWVDVESVAKVRVSMQDCLSVQYKPEVDRYIFGRSVRRKMYGCDELLPDLYAAGGESLIDDAVRLYAGRAESN